MLLLTDLATAYLSRRWYWLSALFLVATFLKVLGANNAIGISGSIALVTAFIIFRPKAVYAVKDCTRLTDNVGVTGILPQVLAALGSVFTAAGVGD